MAVVQEGENMTKKSAKIKKTKKRVRKLPLNVVITEDDLQESIIECWKKKFHPKNLIRIYLLGEALKEQGKIPEYRTNKKFTNLAVFENKA